MPSERAATIESFEGMRLSAMVTDDSSPLRQETTHEMWGDYGRTVYVHLTSERFVQAIVSAITTYDRETKETPQDQMARRLRVFLTTGAIA